MKQLRIYLMVVFTLSLLYYPSVKTDYNNFIDGVPVETSKYIQHISPLYNKIEYTDIEDKLVNSKDEILLHENVTYVSPDILTSGSPSTYLGKPLTDDIFGINWASTIAEENVSASGVVSLTIASTINIDINQTLLAQNLVNASRPIIPEWSTDLYLLEGMFVSSTLSWLSNDADFDLLLIPSSRAFTYGGDVFDCVSCTQGNPETLEGVITENGYYTLIVDFYEGKILDYNFELQFNANKTIFQTNQQYTGSSLEISLDSLEVANGNYEYNSVYHSDADEILAHNSTFTFDNQAPEVRFIANQVSSEIANDTWWVLVEPNDGDLTRLFQLNDAVAFDYTIFINDTILETMENATQTVDIFASDSYWSNETDSVQFGIQLQDIYGRSDLVSGIIIRADTVSPIIESKPSSFQEVEPGDTLTLVWEIDDLYPYGIYEIRVSNQVEQTGVWKKNTPIVFTYTFEESKSYLIYFEAKDPFTSYNIAGTTSDTISIMSLRLDITTSISETIVTFPVSIEFKLIVAGIGVVILFKKIPRKISKR